MNVIELLKKLIAINSINPFTTVTSEDGKVYGIGNEEKILDFIEPLLVDGGFSCKRQIVQEHCIISVDGKAVSVPKRTNLLCEKGSGNSSILFSGHVDTVEVKSGWTEQEALTPMEKVVGGKRRIYGLGSNDMLAGIAVMIRSALDAEIPGGRKLKLAFLCDEEFWSIGVNALCGSSFLDDVEVIFVPEIGESDLSTPVDKKTVCLGRMGRCEFEFTVPGTGGHGAVSRKNGLVNAATDAAKLVLALESYAYQIEKTFTFGDEPWEKITNSAFVNRIDAGMGGLSIPDHAKVIFDRSFVPGEKIANELVLLQGLVDALYVNGTFKEVSGEKISVRERYRPTPASDAYVVSKESNWVKKIQTVINRGIVFTMGNSVADENVYARTVKVPVIVIGPIGEDCHSAHEWVDIGSVEELYEIYKKIIMC